MVPPIASWPLIVLAALAVVAAPAAADGPNLILNPGFEEGEGSYQGVGLHWETNDAQQHPEVDVLTSATKHSGLWSQWLKANPEWDRGMVRQVTPYNSITAGTAYRISAWVKTANVANPAGWYVFGIWWMNNAGQVVGDKKMDQQGTLNYDWREIVLSDGGAPYVTAPPGATRVAVLLTRHTDGDAWYDDVYVGTYSAGPPEIEVSPTSFTHKVIKGNNLPDDTFTVRNSGEGTLNYSITDDADWLSVVPTGGDSTGEADLITIHYTVAALDIGEHNAEITVSDLAASNDPQTVAVTVIVKTPGDMDYDGDVDLEDFGLFQACFSGEGQSQNDPTCEDAKLDDDGDVDRGDFDIFRVCMTGPGIPADPQCAP